MIQNGVQEFAYPYCSTSKLDPPLRRYLLPWVFSFCRDCFGPRTQFTSHSPFLQYLCIEFVWITLFPRYIVQEGQDSIAVDQWGTGDKSVIYQLQFARKNHHSAKLIFSMKFDSRLLLLLCFLELVCNKIN